jgi:hypothetical protein
LNANPAQSPLGGPLVPRGLDEYRESLRDIEVCLSAQSAKLYHMGIRSPIKRSTPAHANEHRDRRIYSEFAQRLITQARKLYADEDLGMDLSNTVYALDSTTIDLCLSLFPWAPFRSTKAAVKMHTLLDLRGNIPSFIHISDGKLHDVNVLDLMLQVFSVTLFEKIPLDKALFDTKYIPEHDMISNQLNLFRN